MGEITENQNAIIFNVDTVCRLNLLFKYHCLKNSDLMRRQCYHILYNNLNFGYSWQYVKGHVSSIHVGNCILL